MHDKYTRAMFICFTCIIVCVLLSSAFSVASGEDGKGKGAEDKNWLIDIEMSPTNPAKNQEVTLRAQVMDSLGNPGKNIPLDISLTSLKSPPDIVGIDFLDDPEPMTDGNGTFETIFNAPYFHSHDDGLYRIDADAEVDGGTVTPASGQLDNHARAMVFNPLHEAGK